jgi:hypothetical protein
MIAGKRTSHPFNRLMSLTQGTILAASPICIKEGWSVQTIYVPRKTWFNKIKYLVQGQVECASVPNVKYYIN